MAERRPPGTGLDRRQLLGRLATSAMILGAHDILDATAALGGTEGGMPAAGGGEQGRIRALRLETATSLEKMRTYYADLLGLPVASEGERELTIAAGASRITFHHAPSAGASPFYHFAFNIPENKILEARAWQLERTELFLTPPNLRDPAYPDDVRHFRSWNAHSVFFWDPAGNVLEFIARHDLANAAAGAFGVDDILYTSEIAFVVDDVPALGHELETRFDLPRYRGSEVFWAAGDERGLLLVFLRGREIGDPLRGRPAPAAARSAITGAGGRRRPPSFRPRSRSRAPSRRASAFRAIRSICAPARARRPATAPTVSSSTRTDRGRPLPAWTSSRL